MRRLEAFLAAAAAAAVAVYALACRPAWHPSGKEVAVPFRDGEASGIAIYNVETGKARRLIEDEKGDLALAQCLWTSDGKTLLVAAMEREQEPVLRVLKIDPASGKTETAAGIKCANENLALPPILVGDRRLWVGPLEKEVAGGAKERYCARVDLATGKAEEFFNSKDRQTLFFDFGKRGCFYVAGPAGGGEEGEGGPEKLEFGAFDPASGERKRLAELDKDWWLLAAEPGGKRFAVVGEKKEGDKTRKALRLLDEGMKLQKEIPLPEWVEQVWLPAWAGGSIWIPVGRPREGERDRKDAGLFRVHVESGRTQHIEIRAAAKDDAFALIQPAVSPDGKRLAVAGSLSQGDQGEGERPPLLFLLDVEAPDKPPVKVPLPAKAADPFSPPEEP